MTKPHSITAISRALILGAIICQCQLAKAGWSGAMNGTGFGWASVNVTSSTQVSNTIKTANMSNPSAAMKTTAGYTLGAALPKGASAGTVARIKGTAGYVWLANTTGSNGDKTDNPSIDKLINLLPSECPSLDVETSTTMAPDGKSGVVVVNTHATAGTAILLRGFEYTDPNPPQTIEDLETNVNSVLKWHVLMVGPFDMNSNNCNALVIPFTIDTSDTNLYFVSDGEAKSTPLELFCPSNITVNCGDPVVYQPASYTGCGDVTVSYDPPADFSFPVGTTPVVITIADQYGDTTNCTFTVTVADTVPPIKPTLQDLTFSACTRTPAIPPTPTTTDNCAGTITGTTTTQFPITTVGKTVVTWCFNDGNGNITTATQCVYLVDNVPPVKPTLPDLNFSACSGTPAIPTAPTTTDNCAGTVTGTTTTHFPITAPGKTVVTWTFSDGNGNSTTATQNVYLTGLTFYGFYTPIFGTGGSCTSPRCVNTCGNIIPITFDINCGSRCINTGTAPVIQIVPYSKNCSAGSALVNANAVYHGFWYYNWNTRGYSKGVYQIIVNLPDGTSQSAFIRLQ